MVPVRASLLLGLTVLLGCGSAVTVDATLTGDDARRRVAAVAADAAQGLPPGSVLSLAREGDSFTDDDPLGPTGCRPAGFPDADPVAVQGRWTSGSTVADPAAALAAVAARWEAQGRDVTRTDATSVRTTVDGVVATVTSYRAAVGITAVSPCFHPGDRAATVTLPPRLPVAG